jgi:hypothetical protein
MLPALYVVTALCAANLSAQCHLELNPRFAFPTVVSCREAIPEIESAYRRASLAAVPAASWCMPVSADTIAKLAAQGSRP